VIAQLAVTEHLGVEGEEERVIVIEALRRRMVAHATGIADLTAIRRPWYNRREEPPMTPTLLRSSLLCALLALIGCEGRPVVPFDAGVESDCTDGRDDDGDGRVDCLDADCAAGPACLHFGGLSRPWESLESRALDLLLVMDNSGGFFAANYAALVAQVRDLVTRLRTTDGAPLDVHLGVTSTDLGTGMSPITYCEEAGGDAGRLLKGDCSNPKGAQTYLIDVAPASCDATRDDQGRCGAHTCTQASCDTLEPGTELHLDDQGCPRCRNYAGVSIEDAFACMAGLGTTGCGFEQPLEALFKALDNNPANVGFIREQARLAVLLVTNEDDCSASNPQLFDPTAANESSLGPLTSFRCFEHGITCDVDDRLATGPRTGCRPRDDPGALLFPIDRYVTFLHGLKDPRQLWVGLVAGPADATVVVERDRYDQPEVQPVCASADASATPAIRLQAFVDAFRTSELPNGASQSICEDGFARVIDDLVAGWAGWQPTCFPGAVAGCTDPAVLAGLPGDGNPCNDVCQARCEVLEVRTIDPYHADWIDPLEVQRVVPPCLEICPEGPCPGNPDPTLAYQGGRPELIAPWLPAESCWYVAHEPACTRSRGAALAIANREPWHDYAGPRPRFQAYCFAVSDPDDPGCP
jgi:hypothetical protein